VRAAGGVGQRSDIALRKSGWVKLGVIRGGGGIAGWDCESISPFETGRGPF